MYDEILHMTEYEEICDSFKEIAKLFEDFFSICLELPTNELLDELDETNAMPIKFRLKESKRADEIILKIKKFLATNEFDKLSLKSRIKNYTNSYIGRPINIDVANRLTQNLVINLLYVFRLYNIYKDRFANENEKLFVINFITSLKNEAIVLNNFLFDCRDLERQRTPLFTIFVDKMGTHLNTGILPEIEF
jgi:hypothetical protein